MLTQKKCQLYAVDDILFFFFFFCSEKIKLDTLCELSTVDDSYEISSLIFSEKNNNKKKKSECHLLQF